jgi:hypothetical protein
MRSALVSMLLTLGCQPSQRPDSPSPADSGDPGDSLPADSSTQPDDSDAAEDTGDTGEPQEPPWGDGPLSVRGQVYFFDMETPGVIDWIQDVEGAEVYLLQAPELRVTVHPDSDHAFEIGGIPEGVEITLAAVHPDYFPHLSATLTTGSEDLEGVTFQAVSHGIAFLAAALLGADASDQSRCQMSTTVSAPGAENVWAPGEPGATVSIDPAVPAEQGPFYLDESVIPDPSLDATTTDGGVIAVGAEPGTYLWEAHKDGVVFEQLKLECVGGWLTNASPPYGLNALGSE